MKTPVLKAEKVGKCFRRFRSEWGRIFSWFGRRWVPLSERWVLKDVSFSVMPGESIGIVGRNGAGKSTLLKLITGTLFPNEGNIRVSGRVGAILELGLGFDPNLTGRENAFFAAGLMGYSRMDIERAMGAIESFADIGAYFDQPLRSYSSGMQMRVAFAVSTAFEPDVLIIDEALAVGDLSFQAKCFERINQLKEKGCTFLFVSHAIDDVVKHCSRALLLDGGRLLLDGEPRHVMNVYLNLLFGKSQTPPVVEMMTSTLFPPGIKDQFQSHPTSRKDEYRWGQGGARIVDYIFESAGEQFPLRVRSNAPIRVSFKVYFERDCPRPVFGFLIKTHDGVILYGTNSFLASRGRPPGPVLAGTVAVCEFSLNVHLNEGTYLLSVGISEDPGDGNYIPLDRRYDSILVSVTRDMKFWGLADLDASVSWTILSTVSSGVP